MDGDPVIRNDPEPQEISEPSSEILNDGLETDTKGAASIEKLRAESSMSSGPYSSYAPGATWREVLRLAWPVLARQFLILLVGLSDRYLAGHFHPHDESQQVSYQAAQTTANYLAWLIVCYTVLVSVGSTALVARFVGAGDRRLAIRVTNQSILLAVIFGLAGSMVGLWGMGPLLQILQLQGNSAKFAAQYLWPTFLFLTFEMIEQAGIACLAGAGDTLTRLLGHGWCSSYQLSPRLGIVFRLGSTSGAWLYGNRIRNRIESHNWSSGGFDHVGQGPGRP